ncbi:MAG: hypothetical protein FH753_15225 [Firmicutes bacterium]|nr:hypothetical protein [Bacillota bacterium]
MNFFPTPYPDEVLYSTLGRYCIRSGNVREIHNFEDLFGTKNCIASLELPSKLNNLVENMPVNSPYTADGLIYNNTLFPFYASFTPPDRAEKIIESMRSGRGGDAYIRLGLVSNSITLNQYFKFCPECFKEDIEIYGEPYWHRIHQITGVFMCPKHKTPIYNSNQLIKAGNRQRFINASEENCIIEKEIEYPDENIEKMIWMAEDAEVLLNNRFGFKEQEWFKSQFRAKLIEKGYARMNNFVHQKTLRRDFIDFYSEGYLELVQSPIKDKGQNWLSSMVRNNSRITFALRYLLLARFLEIPLYTLFNEKIGFSSKENNIDSYQKLWEERLIELCQLDLSIRDIASALDSTPKTVRKAIDDLGIKPFWKYNGGGKYINKKYTATNEFRTKRKESREKWIELLAKYPDKSSNQIKGYNQALYRWLTKYDIEWLRQHSRTIQTTPTTVDWDKRDREILTKVKEVVKGMREGKPERITWTTIGSKLGISGWLSKRKDRLPLTREYIESVRENLKEFQIRKIRWAISKLEGEGREITFWNVVETAGVKPSYMKYISEEVHEILFKKGCNYSFLSILDNK